MSLHDPRDERGPAAAVIVDGAETPRAAAPLEPVRTRRAGPAFAAFSLAACVASGVAGGVVATAIHQGAQPRPQETGAPVGLDLIRASSVVAAADAVVPAVVTIENRSGSSFGTGSGVIIDRTNGYIVTNSHVIERARTTRASSDITVVLAGGRRLDATVIGNDPTTDVAVIRVAAPLAAEAVFWKGSILPIGAAVIAIGTPGSSATGGLLENTVTSGIVSATGRRIPRVDLGDIILADLIQTDASIGPGMSGGPLVLVETREVVGLMTLLVRGDANLAFAIPATTVLRVAEQLIANSR